MPPLDFDHAWPYLGLALAALFLARRGFRPRSLAWLTAAQLPAYAVHQFEEHGVDLIGRRYAFLPFFHEAAARLGLGGSPADPTWVTGVNVGAVWLWGLQAALCGTEEPAVALGMAGLVASSTLGFFHSSRFLSFLPGARDVLSSPLGHMSRGYGGAALEFQQRPRSQQRDSERSHEAPRDSPVWLCSPR